MPTGSDNYFDGDERIENFVPLGRGMRMGSSQELRVTDKRRVLDALHGRDWATGKSYLNLLFPSHFEMTCLLLEWALEWPNALKKRGPDEERKCTAAAFRSWKNAATSLNTDANANIAVELLSEVLSEGRLKPGISDAFREARVSGKTSVAAKLFDQTGERQQQVLKSIDFKRFPEAISAFEAYWSFITAIHDCLVQYCQSYPAAVQEVVGQQIAEKLVHESFAGCSFFEGLWGLALSITPKQLAAFLAEHLRGHFSGEYRGGGVQVIEENDRYRLVFDACGSGGAMRRRLAKVGLKAEVFEKPSSATWNRANEVPALLFPLRLQRASVSEAGRLPRVRHRVRSRSEQALRLDCL